jgi:hypothetical protein
MNRRTGLKRYITAVLENSDNTPALNLGYANTEYLRQMAADFHTALKFPTTATSIAKTTNYLSAGTTTYHFVPVHSNLCVTSECSQSLVLGCYSMQPGVDV